MFEDFNFLRTRISDKTLYVGFIGSSSCGKSSLINAIIGKNLLPVDVLEGNTKIPCIIRHSSRNFIEAVYPGGKSRKFTPKDNYVIPLARKLLALDGIKYISVSLADCTLPDDIALVDTPGTELLPENDAITLYAAVNIYA